MNKQELIKKYKELWDEHSIFYEPVPYTSMVKLFLKDLKQLDEPQPVKVKKFVADWIEYCKARKITLANALYHSEEAKNKSVYRWLFEESGSQEKFARAWLDGYEVEKEKRYFVKAKSIGDHNNYLKYNTNQKHWYFGSRFIYVNDVDTKIHHTRKELEEANFGWVFDCEGIEIEEVE